MTLYLVRHGLALAGTEDLDPGLADVGHEQARITAKALAGRPVARLLVSPLRRTLETAEPIAAALRLEPEIRHEVAEVFDPDMPVEERKSMIQPLMGGRWSEQNANLQAWRKRVVDTLIEVGLAAPATQDVVVVSHYIAIGVAIGEGLGDDRVVPVQIANCSITALEAVQSGLRVEEAASTAHLPETLITGVRQALPGG